MADELRRIVTEQVDRAVAVLGDAAVDCEERIHTTRQRIKKVRAMLRLARPASDEAWFETENAAYRDIARRLSPSRDADVMVRTFDSLMSDKRHGRDKDRLRQAIASCRDAVVDEAVLAQAVVSLVEARQRIATWRFDGERWAMIEPGLVRVYRQGRRTMKRASSSPSDELLHDWRKRVKYTMHHLRALRGLTQRAIDAQRRVLRDLGDVLGEHHDLAVLRATLESEARSMGPARARVSLVKRIDGRRKTLFAQAMELGAEAYAEKPKAWARRLAAYWRTAHADESGESAVTTDAAPAECVPAAV